MKTASAILGCHGRRAACHIARRLPRGSFRGSESVIDWRGRKFPAVELRRRPAVPVAVQSVSYIDWGVSTNRWRAGIGWWFREGCGAIGKRTIAYGISPVPPRVGRSVETTQSLYVTLRSPRGRRVVSVP